MHPLGDGEFGCNPLYSQGFLCFRVFYLGIRDIGDEDTQSLSLVADWTPSDNLSVRLRYQDQEDQDGTRPFFLQDATENFLQDATENNCYQGFRSLASWALVENNNPFQYYCGEIRSSDPIALNDEPDADGVANAIPGLNEGSTFFGTLYNLADGVAFSGVERDIQVFNASIRYEFDNGYQLDFMAGVRDEERKSGSDSDHGPINFIFAPGTESFFALSGIDEYEESSYEIRLSSPVDRAFSWTLGGFWYDYEQDVTDITFSGNTPDGTDNFIKNSAIFGSLSWQVNDRLRMTLEGRYADDEKEQEDYDALGALEFSGDDSFTSFAPRFTVDYGFDDNTLLYGIYSRLRAL